MSDGNLAAYKNINGVPPTLLRQQDFYNYPNKVHLPSLDSQGDDEDSLKKHRDASLPRGAGEDFTETDPLLPNSESVGSGSSIPPQPLRGILRNGPNWQERRGEVVGGGGSAGNRPHLSLLLNSADGSFPSEQGAAPPGNLPFLSQLVSAPHSRSSTAPAQEPQPEQHVHELPPQLQQHLLHHQQLLQQQQQDASTMPVRLVPVSSSSSGHQPPPVNTSLVQMEELKPVMPIQQPSPSPAPTAAPTPALGGAANLEGKGRAGSPARIDPSQQKEVRGGGGGGREAAKPKPEVKEADVDPEVIAPQRPLDDETFRKHAAASSPDEETAHKSVGGSSGLGDSLDLSSPLSMPSDEGRRSRSMYRRSNSEASRSVSPPLPLPPSRSISSPEDKHRPYAVVKRESVVCVDVLCIFGTRARMDQSVVCWGCCPA